MFDGLFGDGKLDIIEQAAELAFIEVANTLL